MGRGWDVLQSAVLHEPVNAGAGDGADHELSSWDGRTDGQTAAVSAACCAGGCPCVCSAVPTARLAVGLRGAEQSEAASGLQRRGRCCWRIRPRSAQSPAAQPAGWGWRPSSRKQQMWDLQFSVWFG